MLASGLDEDQVGAVLAGAEDPVDLVSDGVVAADDLGSFGGKPDLAVDEDEAVGAAEQAEIDGGEGLAGDEIDYGEGVEGTEIGGNSAW